MLCSRVLHRRKFIRNLSTAATAAFFLPGSPLRAAPQPRFAQRPRPPYRVWFQPRFFERDASLYTNMTIDASGWLDPRLAELTGRTALDWVYGPNHPHADGSRYWANACSTAGRGYPRRSMLAEFVSAGIAIDEWVPPAKPENPRWLAEGLRAGRQKNPDIFIAVWCTDPGEPLLELTREGTVDLVIVEGYTHSEKREHSTNWDVAIRRCTALAEAELEHKTILAFGHITARPHHDGTYINRNWLREKAQEIRERFPDMPGIGFFQPPVEDTPEQRGLIRFCDQLSGDLWPDENQRLKGLTTETLP